LNKGGDASVSSVSCTSAGNCVAGGGYLDQHRHGQGFVATERHGRWRLAFEVPGLGALNTGGDASVSSVSCTSAGNCSVAGEYHDQAGSAQGFVAGERNGWWWKAIEVPGLAALNEGGSAGVNEVSCASAGNCADGGSYTDGHGHEQGFVADERHGRWGRAIEVPGLGALNTGQGASVLSVSCAAAGNCAAGGDYTADTGDNSHGFVADERNGVWGTAIEVPGLAALNTGQRAGVFSVSCGAVGSCAAVGDYTDTGDNSHGFVAVERNGVWGNAAEPPDLGADAEVGSVSCPSAGNCAAVGVYSEPYGVGFVTMEKNGVWGNTINVPGLVALDGRVTSAESVSCVSAGNCAAGGFYSNIYGNIHQGYTAVELDGRWGKAAEVPGLGTLNKGGRAGVSSVSCGAAGSCTAAGHYTDRAGHSQGFVT
jgi:hypothetical protein